MSDIRTPDDEKKAAGFFYPPFKAGDTYQGITYAGHSDYAVDWNRRTPSGGWLPDDGEPVLAVQAGKVSEVKADEGYVLIDHAGGWQTEYRHMEPVRVKVGQRVVRGQRIGDIGDAGNAPNGTHLHHRHYKDGKPTRMRFYTVPVRTSISDSDSQQAGWNPPAAVYIVGPQPPATWESAFREAEQQLEKCGAKVDALTIKAGALTEERDAARADVALARTTVDELSAALVAAKARITELENATPPDCTTAIAQERDRVKAAAVAAVEAVQ